MKHTLTALLGLTLAIGVTPVLLAQVLPAEVDETPLLGAVVEPMHESGLVGTYPNPAVEPGGVEWHADLAAARAASESSGRPVLLFQLLGQLDQEFC